MDEHRWTYISAMAIGGQHFSIWAKPVSNKDGTFRLKTRNKESTLEEINEYAKNDGPDYYTGLNVE